MIAEAAGAVAIGKVLVDGLQIGLTATQIWNEYNANLLAKQQLRAASGEQLTMDDVRAELAATTEKLNANHKKLEEMAAAQLASERGADSSAQG